MLITVTLEPHGLFYSDCVYSVRFTYNWHAYQASFIDEALLSISLTGHGQLMKMLITLELHGIYIYRQQIRDARVRILYVSNHIANCARFQSVKFSILPLYKMQTDCDTQNKRKTFYWPF